MLDHVYTPWNSGWKFNRNQEQNKISIGFLKVIGWIITFDPPAYEIDWTHETSGVLVGRRAGEYCGYGDFGVWYGTCR